MSFLDFGIFFPGLLAKETKKRRRRRRRKDGSAERGRYQLLEKRDVRGFQDTNRNINNFSVL